MAKKNNEIRNFVRAYFASTLGFGDNKWMGWLTHRAIACEFSDYRGYAAPSRKKSSLSAWMDDHGQEFINAIQGGWKPKEGWMALRAVKATRIWSTKDMMETDGIYSKPQHRERKEAQKALKDVAGPHPQAAPASIRLGFEAKRKFLESTAWKQLRLAVIMECGRRCCCCRDDQSTIHVDHIIPMHVAPEIRLKPWNLQTLCSACNEAKSWTVIRNWRANKSWQHMLDDHAEEIGHELVEAISNRILGFSPDASNQELATSA